MLNVEMVSRAFGIKSSRFWLPVNKNDYIMEIQNQSTDLGFISGIFEFYVCLS